MKSEQRAIAAAERYVREWRRMTGGSREQALRSARTMSDNDPLVIHGAKLIEQGVSFDENCVICENEGAHDINDRKHVAKGQE